MHPHDDEYVLKVRADGLGSEGVRTRLLEHDGHDVIPDVALPQQLIIEKKNNPMLETCMTKQSHTKHMAYAI